MTGSNLERLEWYETIERMIGRCLPKKIVLLSKIVLGRSRRASIPARCIRRSYLMSLGIARNAGCTLCLWKTIK
jgi:hypothetical protein